MKSITILLKIMTKFYTYFIATILMLLDDKVLSKGQPEEWQMGFQEAASPLMAELAGLHDFVFWIIKRGFRRSSFSWK